MLILKKEPKSSQKLLKYSDNRKIDEICFSLFKDYMKFHMQRYKELGTK